MNQRLLASLGVVGLVLLGSGCSREEGGSASTETPGASASSAPAGGVSPVVQDDPRTPEDYRKMRLRLAMAGLRYEGERVLIDEAALAGRGERGDAAAAARLVIEAQSAIEVNDAIAAIDAATRAVFADEDSPEALLTLARALVMKRKEAEALAASASAVRADGSSTEARFFLADLRNRVGDLEGAMAEARALLEIDPDHGRAHAKLAVWSYYAGELDLAREHADRAAGAGHPVPPQLLDLLARNPGVE